MNTRASRLSVTLVAFLIGVLLMAQFATQQRMNSSRAFASSADGSLLISSLVESNAHLRQEVADLEAQVSNYRTATNQSRLQAMTDDLNKLQILNGVVQVVGPGTQITLDGPATVLDLQDLLNELRNAGAEAIALNGRRIIVSSAILPAPDGSIAIDGVATHRPYVFVAIGDAATLETALLRPGGLIAVFSNSREGLKVNIQKRENLIAPAHAPASFQYAVPAK